MLNPPDLQGCERKEAEKITSKVSATPGKFDFHNGIGRLPAKTPPFRGESKERATKTRRYEDSCVEGVAAPPEKRSGKVPFRGIPV